MVYTLDVKDRAPARGPPGHHHRLEGWDGVNRGGEGCGGTGVGKDGREFRVGCGGGHFRLDRSVGYPRVGFEWATGHRVQLLRERSRLEL